MMRIAVSFALALVVTAAAAGGATAHHGWTSYHSDRTVTLAGTVREAAFEHPHATLRLESEGRIWVVILPPPTRAVPMGLNAQTLTAGTSVTIVGHPHRSVEDEVRATRLVMAGRTYQLR
ncbi:MAG: DUF6152 family protein [Armatimonadota bacterium]|nr:DUF6152 family protein [Armatimonadota bacterium]